MIKWHRSRLPAAPTGLRWGEATAPRVQDLNMLKRRLSVAQNAVYVNGAIIVGTPKTHERRSAPFPRFMTVPLAKACENKSRDALVFPGENGSHMVTPTIKENSRWDQALVRAQLSAMTIHDLDDDLDAVALDDAAKTNVGKMWADDPKTRIGSQQLTTDPCVYKDSGADGT
jgi:integrase